MTTRSDPREHDGGVDALTDLADVEHVVASAVTLLTARVLCQLCGVSRSTIHRYAEGTSTPSPENAARIRIALAWGTLIKYKHSSRVATTFFDVANPWLDYQYPVEVLAKNGPGSEAWDRVGFACASFLFGRSQPEELQLCANIESAPWRTF